MLVKSWRSLFLFKYLKFRLYVDSRDWLVSDKGKRERTRVYVHVLWSRCSIEHGDERLAFRHSRFWPSSSVFFRSFFMLGSIWVCSYEIQTVEHVKLYRLVLFPTSRFHIQVLNDIRNIHRIREARFAYRNKRKVVHVFIYL